MFERYTEKARRVIFFSRYEASQFGAPAIEPEHILLGLMREDKTLTARFLVRAQISLEALRVEIEKRTPLREKISTAVDLPLTPECKRVLAYAHEESDRLQHRHIGTEHLLLGLLREKPSIAYEILYERGLRYDVVRAEVALQAKPSVSSLIDEALVQQSIELNLSGLDIAEVPKEVAQLKHLRRLNLSNLKLTVLPEFIGQLSQLEHLDLSGNNLTELPDSLLSLRSLQTLYLHGNRLPIPPEVLGSDRQSEVEPADPTRILEYYYRTRGAQQSLNEAKLILVGRGGVGKTSIVNRLVFDLFKDEPQTEGIQVTKWNIKLGGEERIRLNIWDFGGQEIMHATHQFFLTHRSLYLLVLSGGRGGGEGADAEYWLQLINSFGDESPVLVILNKINEQRFDVNRRSFQQKYPNIISFIETDCEDGTGFVNLRQAIESATDRLEDVRAPFPKTWFHIKERLATLKTNYISFEDYRELCSHCGEKDPEAQDALASYLHTLGIALNYKNDPRLQDTYVLNPHWVTSGIYTILNSEKVKQNYGEFTLGDLLDILSSKTYPIRMNRFLVDLMKKFELCFSFPDDDCHYLIPELLSEQEPQDTLSFNQNECLTFQYQYSVLPEGLLPRFIVRTYILSEESPRWRTGVILHFEGNHALVKADIQDKRVFISVAGPHAGRRSLLAIIRADLDHIHRNIRNLNPQGMVPLPGHPDVLVPYEKLLTMQRQGLEAFPELVGGKVVNLNVSDLLNGVDLQEARLREILADEPMAAVTLFYSYSHKDERLRDQLNTHLKLMQRRGVIKSWYDRNIDAGDDWKGRIDEHLESADIILLLVSANFIASDYCYDKEMKRALERHKNSEAQVIPIIIRDVDLTGAPFAGMQYLPRDGKPVTLWKHRDSAWRDVSEGISKVADTILRKRAGLQ